MAQAVVRLPPPLPVVLPLLAVTLLRPPRRRRKRVCNPPSKRRHLANVLTWATEKEESDEDMGFGLFD